MDSNDGLELLKQLAELHADGQVHGALTPAAVGGSPRPIPVPELIQGGRATEQSDVYQAGCILYETYEGKPPFSQTDERLEHLHRPVPVAMQAAPRIGAVIAEMMAKDPNRRPTISQALGRIDSGYDSRGPLAGHDSRGPLVDLEAGIPSPDSRSTESSSARLTIARPDINVTTILSDIKQHARRIPPVWALISLAGVILLAVTQSGVTQSTLVPPVVGLQFTDAQKLAADFVLRTEEVDVGGVAGTVVSQRPSAREVRHRGSEVVVSVTLGKPQITVPETKGLTFEEASALLVGATLAVKGAAYESGKGDAERVIKTEPPYKAVVDAGTPVLIVISSR